MVFRQILFTSPIRNVWRTVRRICIFISEVTDMGHWCAPQKNQERTKIKKLPTGIEPKPVQIFESLCIEPVPSPCAIKFSIKLFPRTMMYRMHASTSRKRLMQIHSFNENGAQLLIPPPCRRSMRIGFLF